MARAAGWLTKALVFLAFVGYQFLVHSAFHGEQSPWMRLVLLLLPLSALGYWTLVRAENKRFWVTVLLAAGAGIYWMEQDHLGLVAAYGLPHAIAYIGLLCFFGRTLLPGREALITRLARRVHVVLPEDMVLYTRRLTIIWCVFFTAQIATSALLLKFASLDTWSLFINLLNLPLVMAMFISDYVYRLIRFRHHPQPSIMAAIQVFVQDSSSKNVHNRL